MSYFVKHFFKKFGKTRTVKTRNTYHFNFPTFLRKSQFLLVLSFDEFLLKNPGSVKIATRIDFPFFKA